jgi:hypothetical protein
MDALALPKPPLPLKRAGVRCVQHILPLEIEIRVWTDDGNLRHPSFKGFREDAEMDEVCGERVTLPYLKVFIRSGAARAARSPLARIVHSTIAPGKMAIVL